MDNSFKINVNSDELKAFTKRLETLPRSAFPSAVRATLNGAAFDVKKRTLPQTAKDTFKQRQPNFFKANSTVDKATGFNVSAMEATVGMYENKLDKKKDNYAVKDLEQQEYGGTIKGRSFIGMKKARKGGKGMIKYDQFGMDEVLDNSRFVNARKNRSKSDKQKFIRSAIFAKMKHGNQAFVLGNVNSKGNRTLFRIDVIGSRRKGHKLFIKGTPLFTFRKGNKVNAKATHFMEKAAKETTLVMDKIFIKEATFQFKKHMKS